MEAKKPTTVTEEIMRVFASRLRWQLIRPGDGWFTLKARYRQNFYRSWERPWW